MGGRQRRGQSSELYKIHMSILIVGKVKKKHTVSLLVGVEVVYDFTHPVKGEVVGIDGKLEDAAFVHIVCDLCYGYSQKEGIGVPMSVHIVSRGIPAAAYLEITFATSTKSVEQR